ncbi:acetyl-CoA carboxylase, biotin carboxylase subunit [Clostridium amylolyticum]|uniref:Biotin carboxylase n=1 Tax=Clostridium amylolyticum TaxID=1121298 RepID=A0A1M6CYQ5_9CLOT|nr:acetyl-CoA carboxylase biotin carboxylase subunit [Clostridium amylolyticum]SHI66137.1 acetyl-CoA carboxylase, biotin carboxylase subunit [Clostridium amylolyticum]
MISKILIANRGEIALRIIRACRELGIETVAVYSEADKDSLHVQLADEAICIGPVRSTESYLNIESIISATVASGAQAIHPGFGFLSENPKFAHICKQCGIKFIGPEAGCIELMGNKAKAREMMKKAGVPVVPGYEGSIENELEALRIAKDIGFPVMIKAAAGGGGRGIRIVELENDFINNYNNAKAESMACFNDDRVYIEKYIKNPRHIEFQILADEYGNVIHLGERDCSLQRKNQKVLEEAPSVALKQELRDKMGDTAVKAAKSVNYKNAGTIEFLLDGNNNFYFMEMNTRIQVEHPVTEAITGIDLIKEQINIAQGKKLLLSQKDIFINGHSIECRINAENPEEGFKPCPGKIDLLHIPGGIGVRMDTALYCGYTVPPYYDSMIGKLIVHGKNREEAIAKMKSALYELIIQGIETNIDFQIKILNNVNFINGNYNTSFIQEMMVNS